MRHKDLSCTSCARTLQEGEYVQLTTGGDMICEACMAGAVVAVVAKRPEARDDGR